MVAPISLLRSDDGETLYDLTAFVIHKVNTARTTKRPPAATPRAGGSATTLYKTHLGNFCMLFYLRRGSGTSAHAAANENTHAAAIATQAQAQAQAQAGAGWRRHRLAQAHAWAAALAQARARE